MLDELDMNICRKLEAGPAVAGESEKAKTRLQSLVDRGYCKFARARSGPLRLYTGETMVSLTEAGREALRNLPPN
jgi:hypothetical protein